MIKATIKVISFFMKKIRDDFIAAFSAQAAFFIIISFFPFIMLLLSIVPYFSINKNNTLNFFIQIFPSGVSSLIIMIIEDMYDKATSGTLISLTALSTLWSAGKGFLAIMKGLNSVYEIQETRHSLLLRAISALYTFIFAIMVITTMLLFVFGNKLLIWIEHKFPVLADTALLIISLRTIVGFIILLIFFLLIYVVIPNRKTKIMNELPGAMVCAAGWMAFSYAFSTYIDNYSSFSSMYGSLTAIVLFMLWMYFCMYILFIGAEVNLFLVNKAMINRVKLLYRNALKESFIHR